MGRRQTAGRLVQGAQSVHQAVKMHIQVRRLQEAVNLQIGGDTCFCWYSAWR